MKRLKLYVPKWIVLALALMSPVFARAQQPHTSSRDYSGITSSYTGTPGARTFTDVQESTIGLDNGQPHPIASATMVLDECDAPRARSFRVIPYVWVPGAQGNTTLRNITAPVDVSVGKTLDIIWNDINFAAIGQLEASNGSYGLIFNGLYMSVSPGQRVQNLNFGANFDVTILDLTATYNLNNLTERLNLPQGSSIELLAGFRYLYFTSGLTVTGPQGNSATRQGNENWFDPIIGGRIRMPLCRCLTGQVRGDFGGFDISNASRFTWNIEATVECRCSQHCSFFAGYRWLDIDHVSGSGNSTVALDLNFHGPLVGFAFDF